MGPTITWHCLPTERFGMWWQWWCSGQWGQSLFLREISTGTFEERTEWRWRQLGFRTSLHTTSRDGERGIDIRNRVMWWNRGGWWGPWWLILCVTIVWSSRTCPHGHGVSGYLPPRVINHITYVAQGHSWTILLRSLGALSQSITNWRSSQLVDFWVNVDNCVWSFSWHPWDITLPSPYIHQTSYWKKSGRMINYSYYQVNQKWTKISQDIRYKK